MEAGAERGGSVARNAARSAGGGDARGGLGLRDARDAGAGRVDERERGARETAAALRLDELAADALRERVTDARILTICGGAQKTERMSTAFR